MTVFLLALGLLAPTAFAQADEAAFLQCPELLMLQQDGNGNDSYVPTGASFAVAKSEKGKYGWLATIKHNDNLLEVTDVLASTLKPQEVTGDPREMVQGILTEVSWDDVQSIRYANINVEANRDDAGGAEVFELLGAQGSLGMAVRYGWGFGKCR